LEHSVPGLVARAYHRVKCVRTRSMMRAIAPIFASRHSQSGEICINLLLARMRADRVSKFLRRLPWSVHFAFISLNAG
jgi:sensor histidine kinase regulating citrate/malate metabolism